MKVRFSSSKGAKHYNNWFKEDERWNPSKVTTYTKEEYELLKKKEDEEDKKNKINK